MEPRRVPSYVWVYVPAFLLALALFGVGVYLAVRGYGFAVLAAGMVAVLAVVAAFPIAHAVAAGNTALAARLDEQLLQIRQKLDQAHHRLGTLADQQLLSDRAKAIAYRQKDREALRRAIREDIDKQDWEAALRLADDMDKVFGYRQEAATIRQDLLARRGDLVRRQIDDAGATIARLCETERWEQAAEEAERVRRQFPGEPRAEALAADVRRRQVQTKENLLGQWHAAVDSGDNERAFELLKKLDAYLTPDEGRRLEEKARTMFKGHLGTLRGRFATAVHEHRWAEAVDVGEDIIAEFPNTQMAAEVREKMPVLKERALDGEPVPA